jgi:hypothetical protein
MTGADAWRTSLDVVGAGGDQLGGGDLEDVAEGGQNGR